MSDKPFKIGIFGGTFDPITEAHEAIIREVLDKKLVDRVIVVPTVVTYHRNNTTSWLSDVERMQVISARISEMHLSGYDVNLSDIELRTHGYTGLSLAAYRAGRRYYHTLVEIVGRPNEHCGVSKDTPCEFYTIVGTDEFNNIKSWFMWEEIRSLSHIIAVQGRNGQCLECVFDVDCIPVCIDFNLANVSASSIREAYRGTYDAINRYIKRLPPISGTSIIAHTPIFDLVKLDEVQPGFNPVAVCAPDWVTVMACKNGREYMMVTQLRYGIVERVEEFVCGQVETGELPVDAAIRELREETGIVVGKDRIRSLGAFHVNPAFMTNKMHFFYVYVDDSVTISDKSPDEHEKLETSWVDCNDVENRKSVPAFMKLAILLKQSQLD